MDADKLGLCAINIVVALVLEMAIGIERQFGQHPAGVRTNALVSLGTALFVTLSTIFTSDDPTRIAVQIVSGIGFIGGGAILREGITVRGMNTSATPWCSAAIDALVGVGAWNVAVLGTITVVGPHFLFCSLAHAIDNFTQGKGEMELLYEVKIVCNRIQEDMIRSLLIEQIRSAKLRLQGLVLQDTPTSDQVEMNVHLYAIQHDDQAMNDLMSRLAAQAEVVRVSWCKSH